LQSAILGAFSKKQMNAKLKMIKGKTALTTLNADLRWISRRATKPLTFFINWPGMRNLQLLGWRGSKLDETFVPQLLQSMPHLARASDLDHVPHRSCGRADRIQVHRQSGVCARLGVEFAVP
jgi:hypothetical protein